MGSSVWDFGAHHPLANNNCRTCGNPLPLTRMPGLDVCGACAARARPLPAVEPPPNHEYMAAGDFRALLVYALHWRQQEAKLEFWEDSNRVGFVVLPKSLRGGQKISIYYIRKDSGTGPGSCTEFMNQLYEAMGQPEKMTRPPTPPPQKSRWEWLRKPAL